MPNGARPNGLTWDGTAFWVIAEPNLLWRISADGRQVLSSLTAPAPFLLGLAWDGEALWAWNVAEQRFYRYRLRPGRAEIENSFPLLADSAEAFVTDLEWSEQGLWALDAQSKRVHLLEPRQGQVLRSFPAPGHQPWSLAWDGANLWVLDKALMMLYKLNAQSGGIVGDISQLADGLDPQGLAVIDGALWVADAAQRALFQILRVR